MRKLIFLFSFWCNAMGAVSQTYTSGLTATGSGTSTDVRLGGANPLLMNTTVDLGTYSFGLKKLSLDYFTVLNNGNIGINNASPAYKFDLLGTSRLIGQQIFQGIVASDSNALGSEMLSSANWTSTDWGGTYPSFSHNSGNTTSLTNTLAAVSSNFYQIYYSISTPHSGSVSITYGGVTVSGITQTGSTGIRSLTSGNLSITPTSDFDGSIVTSIRQITISPASTIFASSDGVARLEIRAMANGNNTFIGNSAGRRNTTGSSNTVLGYLAGQANTTGSSNTFMGMWAGQATTSGGLNTVVGNQAGFNNVSGGSNTFLGNQSGYSNLSASDNTFIGRSSGFSNTTGISNTFSGNYAGYYNLTGSWNTFSGYMAGVFNSSGNNNAAFGYYAGYNNSTGGNNTFLGFAAGRFIADNTTNATILNNSLLIGSYTKPLADNQTNQIVIGYNSTGLGSNSTVLGNSSTTKTAVYGSLLVGTTGDSASAILNINSTTRGALMPRMSSVQRTGIASPTKGLLVFDNDSSSYFQWSGAVWQNLYSSGGGVGGGWGLTGSASTNPASNFIGTTDNVDIVFKRFNVRSGLISISNTSFGDSSLNPAGTGINNTALGAFALAKNTSGYSNTAIGLASLYSNTTGYSNVALGPNTLFTNSSGFSNMAIGLSSLFSNTTGASNTAVGNTALNNNTTGNYNTGVGASSLFQNTEGVSNTAIGYWALRYSTTGSDNTAIGVTALRNNTTGKQNVALGRQASYLNTTGSGLVSVGFMAGYSSLGDSSTTIGYQAGFSSTGGGNVMLGYQAGYAETGSNKLYIANSSTNTPLIYGDFTTGHMGIGTTKITDADYKLFVETGIRTRKVKVDALTWADYVFDNDYKLPSLADVDSFIKHNKHLPGVQSEDEVKRNGIDIAENQVVLLKKIEEMTLYLIELDKKVKLLSEENQVLQKKLKGN